MKCTKCGAEVAEGIKFCSECGNSMVNTTSSNVNPPKKKFSKKQGCFGCLGLIFIMFIALGLIGSCANKDSTPASTKSNNQQAEQKKEKAAPEFTFNIEGVGKVKGGVSSNVGIAVADVSETTEIGNQFHSVKAQGKYIVVAIAVHNNQKDAITVDSNSYKLIDDQKREFDVSIDAWTALQMSKGDAKGFLSKVNPGLSTMVEFPFEVPKNVKGLKLKAQGGFTGEEIILPLQVQKVN